jgi:hypothetical protein
MNDEVTRYEEDHERQSRMPVRPRPRNLLARGSRPVPEHYQDEDGEWRIRVRMSRKMFRDREKAIFLEEYAKHGRLGDAAAAAGVSSGLVRKELKEDEDFAEAMMIAEDDYRDKLLSHHQDLIFNGTERISYDRNGNISGRETIYPIRLIELELKKWDEGYREKQEVKHNVTGGVLFAPAETKSIDDWESRFSKARDVTPSSPPPSAIEEDEDEEQN